MKTKKLFLDKKTRKQLRKTVDRKIDRKTLYSNLLPPGHTINDVHFYPEPECLVHNQPLMECWK
jgi:hypothetical protein